MSNSIRALAVLALLAIPLAAQSAPPTTATLQANGRSFNGIQFNGVWLNGLGFNGARLNGKLFNGIGFNGIGFNGRMFNGTPFEGTLSRRSFVGVFEADAGMSAGANWSSLALADVRVRLPLAN